MPRPFRHLKIASFIEHELSNLITREVEIPGAMITITDVEVSEDLDNTKITFSVFPYEKELEAYTELEKRRKEFEYKILKKSHLRVIPKFVFLIHSQMT